MKFTFAVPLITFALAISPFARRANATGDDASCSAILAPVRNTFNDAYLNLAKRFAEKAGAAGAEILERVAKSSTPQSPVDTDSNSMSTQDRFAFRLAFKKILSEKGLDWNEIRVELLESVAQARAAKRRTESAKVDTAPIFAVVKSDTTKPPSGYLLANFVSSNGTRYGAFAQNIRKTVIVNFATGAKFVLPNKEGCTAAIKFFEFPIGQVGIIARRKEPFSRRKGSLDLLSAYAVDTGAPLLEPISLTPQLEELNRLLPKDRLTPTAPTRDPELSSTVPYLNRNGAIDFITVWELWRDNLRHDLGATFHINSKTGSASLTDRGSGVYSYYGVKDGGAVYAAEITVEESKVTIAVNNIGGNAATILTDTVDAKVYKNETLSDGVKFFESANADAYAVLSVPDKFIIYNLKSGTKIQYPRSDYTHQALGLIEDRTGQRSILLYEYRANGINGKSRLSSISVDRHEERELITLPADELSNLVKIVTSKDLGPIIVWYVRPSATLTTLKAFELESKRLHSFNDKSPQPPALRSLAETVDGRLEFVEEIQGKLVFKQIYGPVGHKGARE